MRRYLEKEEQRKREGRRRNRLVIGQLMGHVVVTVKGFEDF